MKTQALLLLLAMGITGCARNAIFNLDVVIPAQTVTDGRRYAFIAVSSGQSDFDEQPFAVQGAVNVDLTEGRRVVPFAVTSSDPTTAVRVLVRYCHEPNCAELDLDMRPFMEGMVPGYRYAFEHPFYIGAVTSYTLPVPALGMPAESSAINTVCRCAIEGCGEAEPGSSHCYGTAELCTDDPAFPHFCE